MIARNPTKQLEKIDAELRRLGLLTGPIQPAVTVNSAFGMDEMSFEHWLVKVFLPRAYEASESNQWPPKSQVGLAAMRNFDGRDEYATLVTLLHEFDQQVEVYSPQAYIDHHPLRRFHLAVTKAISFIFQQLMPRR